MRSKSNPEIEIPEGYRELTEEEWNGKLESNYKSYSHWSGDFQNISYKYTNYNVKMVYSTDNVLITKSIMTQEEKIKEAKNKAKLFVTKHLGKSSKDLLDKYEQVFMREDNFGL